MCKCEKPNTIDVNEINNRKSFNNIINHIISLKILIGNINSFSIEYGVV